MTKYLITLALLAIGAPAAAESSVADPALELRAQSFGGWEDRLYQGDTFNEFDLSRAELGTTVRWPDVGGVRLTIEGVRSAGPDSLLGVDGDSIVLRVKHAYGFGEPELGPGRLLLQAGMVEDPWIAALERDFDLRGHGPTSSERTGLFDTSDLGATVGYDLLDGIAVVRVSMTNGEGRNEIELNRGKNTTVVASTTPVRFDVLGDEARASIHGGFRDGSLGVARARNHRAFGALTLSHPRGEVGIEFVRALGVPANAAIEAQVLGAWLRAEPIERWLGVLLRFERYDADLDQSDDATTRLQAAVYSDLLRGRHDRHSRVRLFAGWDWVAPDANAPGVPGVPGATEYHAIRLTLEATGIWSPDHAGDDDAHETGEPDVVPEPDRSL